MAKSLESGTRHKTKDNPWTAMSLAMATLKDPDKLSQLEVIECTQCVKEKYKRFTVNQDNTKKACLLMCGHCNEAMQAWLKNDTEFETVKKSFRCALMPSDET